MTALTRLTKAQLIEQVTRLTAENNTLHDDIVRDAAARNDLLVQLRILTAERDTLQRELSMERDRNEALTIQPVDESTAAPRTVDAHHAPTPAPSRKLREPNEVERKRLAIIDQCHRLTKLHRSTVWYDWKYGEFRTRRDGAIQVLEDVAASERLLVRETDVVPYRPRLLPAQRLRLLAA